MKEEGQRAKETAREATKLEVVPKLVPLPSPGDLLELGIKPRSLALQTDALPSEPPGKPINSHRTK